MIVKIAEKAGFCFGVKRAVDMALDYTDSHDSLLSYGQLIHNDQVTDRLAKKGVSEVDSLEAVYKKDVLIRSHGVGKNIYDLGRDHELNLIDCTCPYVKKVHKIVDKHYREGYEIIIVGNATHPEIQGINGWCNEKGIIISSINDIKPLKEGKYCVVSQTTLQYSVWEEVQEALSKESKEILFFNTICSATSERQEAVKLLATEVDCMIVIGGYHSSNTRKLYEICMSLCKETIHIEKKSDLMMTNLKKYGIIGITAGASTPDWIIKEIYDYLLSL